MFWLLAILCVSFGMMWAVVDYALPAVRPYGAFIGLVVGIGFGFIVCGEND